MKLKAITIAEAFVDLKNMDFRSLGDFAGGSVGVFRSGLGTSTWERHPDGEELLQMIEGAVRIELLTDTERVSVDLAAGQMLIVPRGHWHRHLITDHLAELYITAGSTEHSNRKDPRTPAEADQ